MSFFINAENYNAFVERINQSQGGGWVNQSGTNWMGDRRSQLGSVFDTNKINKDYLKYLENSTIGDPDNFPGTYTLQVKGSKGQPAPGAKIRIGDRQFGANAKGEIRIVDSSFLNTQLSAFKNHNVYLSKLIDTCIVSNNAQQAILGEAFFALCGAGTIGRLSTAARDELIPSRADQEAIAKYDDVDCTASAMYYLDYNSLVYSRSLNKLRLLVNASGASLDESEAALLTYEAAPMAGRAVLTSTDAAAGPRVRGADASEVGAGAAEGVRPTV